MQKQTARNRIWNPPTADGRRLLMVGMELMMSLYALLYAFPHIPAALMEDVTAAAVPTAPGDAGEGDEGEEGVADAPSDTQWYSVSSTAAMRASLEALLRTSEVLEVSLRAGATAEDIKLGELQDARALSRLFDLHLYEVDADVPITCRQMYECIAAIYRALGALDITTREELRMLYQRHQLLPTGYKLPGLVRVEPGNRSALIHFCSELTVDWMQPYFSRHPGYYMPRETADIVRQGRA